MSDLMMNLAFVSLAGMACVSAVFVTIFRNLIHAALALFVCLGSVAGLYVLLGADFVAMAQLIIYAGGVVVLIIFGVFLTSRIYTQGPDKNSSKNQVLSGSALAILLFIAGHKAIQSSEFSQRALEYAPTTKDLGTLFLSKYLLPFEVISVLLLFAMVGAVMIVRKEIGGDKNA